MRGFSWRRPRLQPRPPTECREDLGMIRKSLFVAFALLLLYPCLRNAADPGAVSSMKGGPARACDNGDTIPVPAMAATAGFPQCVLNADFTKLDGFFSRTS